MKNGNCKAEVDGQSVGIKFCFPLNNFSLFGTG